MIETIRCLTNKDALKLYNFIIRHKDLFATGEVTLEGRKVTWRLLG